MTRILYITASNDPLVPLVREHARQRGADLAVDEGQALRSGIEGFDALLVGDISLPVPLAGPLPGGPKHVQLTRGHHRDVDAQALSANGVTVAGSTPVTAGPIARIALKRALGIASAIEDGGSVTIPEISLPGDSGEAFEAPGVHDFSSDTVGIIGMGRSGRAMAELCHGVGATVIYADIRTAPHSVTREQKVRRVTVDQLASRSDYVSLHVQWGPTSDPLISDRELRLMKDRSVLVNFADARLVETAALKQELSSGRLRAALDIEEPAATELNVPGRSLVTRYTAARESTDPVVAEFVVSNILRSAAGEAPQGVIEVIDYPRAGDPAFWSSKMSPRTG